MNFRKSQHQQTIEIKMNRVKKRHISKENKKKKEKWLKKFKSNTKKASNINKDFIKFLEMKGKSQKSKKMRKK